MFELVIYKRDANGQKTDKQLSFKRAKGHQLATIYHKQVVEPEKKLKK
jgi:hypothetical protein